MYKTLLKIWLKITKEPKKVSILEKCRQNWSKRLSDVHNKYDMEGHYWNTSGTHGHLFQSQDVTEQYTIPQDFYVRMDLMYNNSVPTSVCYERRGAEDPPTIDHNEAPESQKERL